MLGLRSVASWAAFAALTADVLLDGSATGLDRVIMRRLRSHTRAPASLAVARAASAMGDPWPAIGLAVLGSARNIASGRPVARSVLRSVALLAGGTLVRASLCRLVRRERPEPSGRYAEAVGFSFPSKHTTLATLALFTTASTVHDGARVAIPIGSAVAVSRVYLGVHWPTDVAAALVFSLGWASAVDQVLAVYETGRLANRARSAQSRVSLQECAG